MEFCDVGQDVLVKYLVVLQPSINFNYTKHFTTPSFLPIVSNHIVIDGQLNFCLFVHKINRCITEKKVHKYLVTKTSYFDTSASQQSYWCFVVALLCIRYNTLTCIMLRFV